MGAVFECMGACEPAVCEASKLPTPWGFNTLGVIIQDDEEEEEIDDGRWCLDAEMMIRVRIVI